MKKNSRKQMCGRTPTHLFSGFFICLVIYSVKAACTGGRNPVQAFAKGGDSEGI
jgi:hypothetical protein